MGAFGRGVLSGITSLPFQGAFGKTELRFLECSKLALSECVWGSKDCSREEGSVSSSGFCRSSGAHMCLVFFPTVAGWF